MFFLLLFLAPQNLQEKEVSAYPAKTRKILFVSPQTLYSRKSFQKNDSKRKKQEKKKADKRVRQCGDKRKRNKSRRVKKKKNIWRSFFLFHYAVSFWQAGAWDALHNLAVFLAVLFGNLSVPNVPLMKSGLNSI